MRHFIYLISIFTIFLSCNNSDNSGKILSEKKFIEVLTDMHHADGILTITKLSERSEKEQISMYNYIFKKNNISRAEFYYTLEYYTKHSDEYLEVYNKVLKNLENKYKVSNKIVGNKQKEEIVDPTNLWPKKTEFNLPEEGEKFPVPFKIYTREKGTYHLSADVMVFSDDQSVDLRMTMIATYIDKTTDMNTRGIILKDDKFHHYETYLTVDRNKELETVMGWVLDHSDGTKIKHIEVKNINLKIESELSHDEERQEE